MARRIFIGGLLANGASMETTASMTGHAKNSKSISRYYNIEKSAKKSALALEE